MSSITNDNNTIFKQPKLNTKENFRNCNTETVARRDSVVFGSAAIADVPRSIGSKILNGLAGFMKHVENKGFFAEFLLVDFFGLILPRTYQAYNRNEKELGHKNIKAAKEEFEREILSGPSMFLIPLGFIASSKKIFGAASALSFPMLQEMQKISKETLNKGKGDSLIRNFYSGIVEKLYCGSTVDEASKSNLVEKFIEAQGKKGTKLKEALERVTETISSLNKSAGINETLGISFTNSAGMKFNNKDIKIGEFAHDCVNYASDVIITLSNAGKEANLPLLEKIHKFKGGARKLISTVAFATVAGFLLYLPKLYQKSTEFPGVAGLNNSGGGK